MAVVPGVAEEAFLSDVHLYTPFLQTSKENVGMYSRSDTIIIRKKSLYLKFLPCNIIIFILIINIL